jgi:hypothetical protein
MSTYDVTMSCYLSVYTVQVYLLNTVRRLRTLSIGATLACSPADVAREAHLYASSRTRPHSPEA